MMTFLEEGRRHRDVIYNSINIKKDLIKILGWKIFYVKISLFV